VLRVSKPVRFAGSKLLILADAAIESAIESGVLGRHAAVREFMNAAALAPGVQPRREPLLPVRRRLSRRLSCRVRSILQADPIRSSRR
jgi:hypothetical protein